jgi:hypothetical protein
MEQISRRERSQTYNATSVGNYSIRVMYGGCSGSSTATTIIQLRLLSQHHRRPELGVQTKKLVLYYGKSIWWTKLPVVKGRVAIDGAPLFEYTTAEPGAYSVRAIFGGGCEATSENLTLTENPAP